MPIAMMEENSVRWFVDKLSNVAFLEYDFKKDKIKIHNEESYYHEGIWILPTEPLVSTSIKDWVPENCPVSINNAIIEKIYIKRATYNILNYVFISPKLHKINTVKAVMTKDSIKWFSFARKEPFLEYYIKTDDLQIYDIDTYIFERYAAIYDLDRTNKYPIKRAWYPESCSDSVKEIIYDIIHGDFFIQRKIG